MGDGFCVAACRDLGAWGEAIALLAIVARWVWAETRRRQLSRDRDGLQAQVRELSQRPPKWPEGVINPAGGLTLQIPGFSLSPSPYPSEAQATLPPEKDSSSRS